MSFVCIISIDGADGKHVVLELPRIILNNRWLETNAARGLQLIPLSKVSRVNLKLRRTGKTEQRKYFGPRPHEMAK